MTHYLGGLVRTPMADGALTFQIFPVVAPREAAWKPSLMYQRQPRRNKHAG
jgi:hypothetical protein